MWKLFFNFSSRNKGVTDRCITPEIILKVNNSNNGVTDNQMKQET